MVDLNHCCSFEQAHTMRTDSPKLTGTENRNEGNRLDDRTGLHFDCKPLGR